MLKRYRMYCSEAVGKIEMYLLCQKYHMSGCVQCEPTNEMMVELYGEPDYGVVILELDRNIMQI